jgi:predicted transcriptional regulator
MKKTQKSHYLDLSRRESQIMDVVYRLREAGVAEVQAELPDPPGYNSVRVTLTILERKGFLKHLKKGKRYIYRPVLVPDRAKVSVLKHLQKIFFEDSPTRVISTLLDMSASQLSDKEIDELSHMIKEAKKRRSK